MRLYQQIRSKCNARSYLRAAKRYSQTLSSQTNRLNEVLGFVPTPNQHTFLSNCASEIFAAKHLHTSNEFSTIIRPALWIIDDLLSFENCPSEVVKVWAGSKMDLLPDSGLKNRVRFSAYAHPNCPQELLEIAAVDPDFCAAAANNINCSARTRLIASLMKPNRVKAPWARLRRERGWG